MTQSQRKLSSTKSIIWLPQDLASTSMRMERRRKRTLALMISGLVLASIGGCSTWRKLDKTEQGAILGAGGGALVGGAATGNAGGALLGGAAGGVAGGVIGNELKKDDRRHRY